MIQTPKKIVDCFTLFNELDLLEIRLKYLFDTVDYFVIVEADRTHNGAKKDYFLRDNMDRFKSFQEKIIYVPIEMKEYDGVEGVTWKRENYQRNCIQIGLDKLNLNPNDFILISDLDEIPDKSVIKSIKDEKSVAKRDLSIRSLEILLDPFKLVWKKKFKKAKYIKRLKLFYYSEIRGYSNPIIFRMSLFYYYLNYKKNNGFWSGTVCVQASLLNFFSPNDIRDFRLMPLKYVDNAGWHFSYLGGVEAIKHKLRNFAHQEHNIPDILDDAYIEFCIRNGFSLYNYYKEKTISREYENYKLAAFPEDLRAIIASYHKLLLPENS
ncbi:hypothetical protein [Eudoraea chungangensis]|uniref:hypothetical protein n=1 Tax=Eudoraea chungangensis TaxID=1481905 RepID=UPI0023ED4E74|nr:hypothetical protein [Eudoraea chungangensis]